ncbi:PQQ-dependent sugar dehydrogenase [Panacibacter ginsenosidivorans]|nr:PQQ-dependent sugar dehydrogenase [Panacibacter ginsenosidivorans]
MKKGSLLIISIFLLQFYFIACHNRDNVNTSTISQDSAVIATGEAAFILHCSGCHNFREDGIGPQLGGITKEISADWISRFIIDPKKIIQSGDERAQQLIKKYKIMMPSFASFTNDEMNGIIAFLNTRAKPAINADTTKAKALANPIPDSIKISELVAGLQLVTQIPPSSDSNKLPLTRITKLDIEPNSGNTFILDLHGKLYKLQNNKPVVYMDIKKLEPKFISEPGLATGFGSFAFHPDFAKNGLLYTTHTEPAGTAKADFGYEDSIKVTLQWVLTVWKADDPAAATFSGKGRELLRVNMVSGIHGIQEIIFNPLAKRGDEDYGLLYIGIGEGGCVENGYPFLAHSKEHVYGTVLRIDPKGNNSVNGKYGIPQSNPFATADNKVLKEIYAFGFRNPHRITWSRDGKMLVCNVGHGNIESVDMILPGHDYGWPIREGSFMLNPYGKLNNVYPLPPDDSIYKVTYPVAEYDHDEGKAICGGYEYWGTAIPQLKGKFLFGDIPTGRLFYIDMADIKLGKQATIKEWKITFNGEQKSLRELCGSDRVDLHFGRDANGEIYILTKADGKVYKLASAHM